MVLLVSGSERACAGEIDLLLFGSLDAGSATFLTAGAKLGLDPRDRDGVAVLATLGVGHRDESAGRIPAARFTVGGAATLGYRWVFDWGVAAAFAGPEATMEMLVRGGMLAGQVTRYGLRLHGEVWAHPSADTLIEATAIAGSARDGVWTRLAWGYRLWGSYLGPEAALYADASGYRKASLGLHATDFALGGYSFRAAAGIQAETGRSGLGPYVALAAWSLW